MASKGEVSRLLIEHSRGNREALTELLPLVYDELRRLAAYHLRSERPEHTLQATALVHEAYLKLVDQRTVNWQNRAHFLAVAAQVMRHILVDYARARRTDKRGGGRPMAAFEDVARVPAEQDPDLVALDDALRRLARVDEQQGRIVELRYFGGLSIEETAEVLAVSPATVKRDWTMAKAWLRREIST
jgi:RNA polymerase sigma factor (TIGR02999 family)